MEKLPNRKTCKEAVDSGTFTSLEKFIYDQEPAGIEQSLIFRQELLGVLMKFVGYFHENK